MVLTICNQSIGARVCCPHLVVRACMSVENRQIYGIALAILHSTIGYIRRAGVADH